MKVTPIRLALITICAIIFTDYMGLFSSVIIFALVSVGLGIGFSIIHKIDLGSIIFAITFLIASVSYSLSVSTFAHPTLEYTGRYVTITGTTVTQAKKSPYSDNYQYTLRAKHIENSRGRFEIRENILLTSESRLNCGDSVTVRGIINTMPQRMNENGFDATSYYLSKNIMTRIYSNDITPTDKIRTYSLIELGGRLSEKVDSLIFRYYDGDSAALLSAVLTGNMSHFSPDYNKLLTRTAFKRVLHPAYLHIWIIMSLVGLVRSRIKRQWRDALTAVIFIVYALLQCTNIGFARCLVCGGIAILYRLRRGDSYFPDTIAFVVILCAVLTPTMLFNVSFVLSVSGGLIIWAFVPYVSQKLRFVPRILRRPIAVLIVCALFCTPLASIYFSGLCIYSFFMPIITAPAILFLLLLSPVALTAGPIIHILDPALDFIYALPWIIHKLPLSHINIGNPSKPMAFAIITAIFTAYYYTRGRKRDLKFMAAMCSGFLCAAAALTIIRIPATEFTFVNVGQGDGAVIMRPFRETIIIDGGGGTSYSDYNPGEQVFLPYIESKGINRIDAAIVSHYHQDHVQGVIAVIENIRTDVVYAPRINDYDSDTMKMWADKLEKAAHENGAKLSYITDDTRIEFGSLSLDIYMPDGKLSQENENDSSMPIRAQYGDFSVLYTGDMSAEAEKAFINRIDADSDVLKVSHHGSRSSSCKEFIDKVSPDYSVISCGVNNMYSHPHSETLDRLKDSRILRTDLLGDITVSGYKNGKCAIK